MARQYVLDEAKREGCSQESAVFLILNAAANNRFLEKDDSTMSEDFSRGSVFFLKEGQSIEYIPETWESTLSNNSELDLRKADKLGPITCREKSRKLLLKGEKEKAPGLFLSICLGVGTGITIILAIIL